MANVIILGSQWGDEGKGKIVDLFSEQFDIVARYQGGHNAGHTVFIGDRKYVLKLIPSGILRPGIQAVIGNGVVVDPISLVEEIEGLLKAHGLVEVGSDPLLDLVEAQAQRMIEEGGKRQTRARYVVWGDVPR